MDMFREKTTGRRDFKSGLNAEELRTKRAENAVSLRKQEREEQLARRRRQNVNEEEVDVNAAVPDAQQLGEYIMQMQGQDPAIVLEAAKKIRQLLSLERNPPIDAVIALGGVPKLIALLDCPHPKVVFEAAWALTNIASGTSENTRAVVEAGGVPRFITLLECPDDEVRDQAVWALGNITGESSAYRDMVLSLNAMPKLLRIAHSQVKLCMLRNIAWTLSNFCRGKNPQPDFSIVSTALPTLYNMISFDDDDIVADACWALSYLSDDVGDDMPENAKIEAVISAGVIPRLVQLLSHPSHHVKTPALRAIGNVVTGNNTQTQTVLNQNVLPALLSLLNNQRRSIRKEACWTISNITAGTPDQVRQVITANIFHKILDMVETADMSIKKEIAWALSNALSNDDKEIMQFLVSIGVIPRLAELLRSEDAHLNLIVLDSLDHLLAYGQKVAPQGDNPMASLVENAGILDILEVLQSNASEEVYNKCYNLVTKYFSDDVEERVVGEPEVNAEGTFQFGGNDNAAFDF